MVRELYDHRRVRVWAVPQLFDQILAVGRAQKRQRLGADERMGGDLSACDCCLDGGRNFPVEC